MISESNPSCVHGSFNSQQERCIGSSLTLETMLFTCEIPLSYLLHQLKSSSSDEGEHPGVCTEQHLPGPKTENDTPDHEKETRLCSPQYHKVCDCLCCSGTVLHSSTQNKPHLH